MIFPLLGLMANLYVWYKPSVDEVRPTEGEIVHLIFLKNILLLL